MSQDGLLLSALCKRRHSHLEVTEWDLYQPAPHGHILAVVFYDTFFKEKKEGRGEEGGAVWL